MQARIRQMSLFAVGAVASVVILGGTAFAQSDPWVGTWKVNLAKSKYDPGPAPKTAGTVKIEVAGNGYKVTTDDMNAQGVATHEEQTVATVDGKDYPIKGSADVDSVSLKKIDANTFIQSDKKGGAVVRMSRTVIAKDGKTYTVASVGYNAQGVARLYMLVFDKQ
jgi:hypothetical protein